VSTPGAAADSTDVLAPVYDLLHTGRFTEAEAIVRRFTAEAPRSYERCHALILRITMLVSLGRTEELVGAVDDALVETRGRPEPYLHGQLHALAALAANRSGGLVQTVMHLVRSQRALRAITEPDNLTPWGWYNLAMAYSYAGIHGYAVSAIEMARKIGAVVGVPDEALATPGIRLRFATWHDHHGDTASCLRILCDVASEYMRLEREGRVPLVRPTAVPFYGYAAARLAALGRQSDVDCRELFAHIDEGRRSRDLVALGEACLAINEGRPIEALARLGSADVSAETVGPAEVDRLMALAHVRAGDFRSAYEADRRAFRIAAEYGERLREVFVEGVAARLDHEDLRRTVERYADEALTDALTGLPNRRHLEQYVAGMVQRGEEAVVGVCDMDGFKAVNTRHGHLAGDLVLERVAAIVHRVMRRGDFVARYGGDEFVVVLPRTSLAEAAECGERIRAAVAAEDWSALVPGTPVGVSIGWSEVVGPRMRLREALVEAFEAADRAMLEAKTGPRRTARAS